MGANAIRSHNTTIARQDAGVGAFVNVEEVLDVTPPGQLRTILQATAQSDNFPYKVLGMADVGDFQFGINFSPGLASHEGLLDSRLAAQIDGWMVTYSNGETWIFSGGIANIEPTAPIDDILKANVTVAVWGEVQRS